MFLYKFIYKIEKEIHISYLWNLEYDIIIVK